MSKGKPEPNWQPISQLALIANMVQGMLRDTQKQYQTFLDVADKPHVLDDAIVQRAQRVFRTHLEDMWLYETQCTRWLKEKLTDKQRKQVHEVEAQVALIKETSEAILALLKQIESGTIDKIMAKSDYELGLEFLGKKPKKGKKR